MGVVDALIEVGNVMRLRRILAVSAVASAFVLFSALPAVAQDGGGTAGVGGGHGRRISVTGGLVVAVGETVDGPAVSADGDAVIAGRVNGAVYVGRGDLVVRGRVTGDTLVLDGDAVISGRVDGDITVINGKATVLPGADVGGDVTSRTTPTAARGTVHGHVKTFDLESAFTGFLVVILALLWVAVTISTAILGLLFVTLFPRAADATVEAGRRVWVSFFWGLVIGIIAPILGILFMTSVVGIPLGGAFLGTVAVLWPLGYVAGALGFGRLLVRGATTGGRIGAFFAGFGILRFAALVPGLGFLVGFVVATYGFGALVIAGWRGAHRPGVAVPGMPPAPALAAGGGPPTGPAGAPTAPVAIAPVPVAPRAPARRTTRKATAKKTTKKTTKRTTKKTAKRTTKKATKRTTKRPTTKATPARKRTTRATSSGRRPATKKAAARKTTAKKTSAKKTSAKKPTAKKPTAKKPAARKPPKRTSAAKRRTTAKTGPARKSSATRQRATATAKRSKTPSARTGPRRGR